MVNRGKREESEDERNSTQSQMWCGLEGSRSKFKKLQVKFQCGGGKEDRTPDFIQLLSAFKDRTWAYTWADLQINLRW